MNTEPLGEPIDPDFLHKNCLSSRVLSPLILRYISFRSTLNIACTKVTKKKKGKEKKPKICH